METTIKHVAKRAKVAIGTVSRVLNSCPDVDPQLRERVEQAIKELSYRPNARARSFVRKASPVISFILSNRTVLQPFHAGVLQGAEEFCSEAGFFVLFTNFQYSPDTKASALRLPDILQSHGIADCLILAGTNYENFVLALEKLRVPYVIFGNNYIGSKPREPLAQVRWDDVAAFYEATRYMIQLGHRDIWYIGDTSLPWFRSCHAGYAKAMKEHGLEPLAQAVALSDNYYTNGYRCTELILEKSLPVTAIFAATDEVAFGAWDCLANKGMEVPRDISLIGCDDSDLAQLKVPPLTTVRVSKFEIGKQLARMAIERLKFPTKAVPEVVVPAKLIKRGTTRPIT